MRQLVAPKSPLAHFAFEPGDVVLTARTGLMSYLTRRASGTPFSHAAIMVTPEWGIEMRDPEYSLTDTTGGIFLCSGEELATPRLVDEIAVRRPQVLDVAAFQSWILARLQSKLTFASAGLALMGPLKAINELGDWLETRPPHARLQRLWFALTHRTRLHQAHLMYAIADGPDTMICSELVYRALAAGGCRLDLTRSAYFAAQLTELPDIADVAHSIETPIDPTFLSVEAQRRGPTPGMFASGLEDTARAIFPGLRNLTRRYRLMRFARRRGDKADFIVPSDLFLLAPLITVAAWKRSGSAWVDQLAASTST